MTGENLFMIVDTVALVTLVGIQGIFFLQKGPFVFIKNMTLEGDFRFRTEVAFITFELKLIVSFKLVLIEF